MDYEDKEQSKLKDRFLDTLSYGILTGILSVELCRIAIYDSIRGSYCKIREKLSRAFHPLSKNTNRILRSFYGEEVYKIGNEKYLVTKSIERDLAIERRIIGRLVKEGKIYMSYLTGSDELPFSSHTDGELMKYYDYIPLRKDERNSEKIRELELSLREKWESLNQVCTIIWELQVI